MFTLSKELVIPEGADKAQYRLTMNERSALLNHALDYYNVPGRHYHNADHVMAMLQTYSKEFKHSPTDAMFLAIIMHDAVWVPFQSPASEKLSAALTPVLFNWVIGVQIPIELNDRVNQLIDWTLPAVHTKDHTITLVNLQHTEEAALVDLDLNTMSSDWTHFVFIQKAIDREFAHRGTLIERMRAGASFLNMFVQKGFVYYTPQMQERNKLAMRNLKAYVHLVLNLEIYDWDAISVAKPDFMEAEYRPPQ